MTSAEERARWLRREVERMDREYYTCWETTTTTTTFDAYLDELLEIEREHPDLATADSPTRKIGPRK